MSLAVSCCGGLNIKDMLIVLAVNHTAQRPHLVF